MLFYAMILYNNAEYRAKYGHIEPQFYFLKAYVYGYGIILLGSIVIFVIVAFLGAIFTGKLLKKKSN
jgi:hypothetical protein